MTDPTQSAAPSPPPVPPPDLHSYTPPTPSLQPPPITPPPVPSPEEARRINLKVAPEEVDEATLNGAAAPFNTRFLAALIDVFLTIGLQLAAAMILPSFASGKIAWLIGIAYLLTRDCLPFLGGQSVGKKAMGLKALTSDGRTLMGNWQPGLIRNAVLLIPLFMFIEIFILITREDKAQRGLRLGDEWAGTKVVIHRPEPPATTP